jgi:ABC-type sugar transport system permease subunit
MLQKQRQRIIVPFLFPAGLLFVTFFLFPIVNTVYLSLHQWNGVSDPTFVGPENYIRMVGDPNFTNAVFNTFALTIVGGAMLFPVAVAIAWALNHRLHGEQFFRFVVFAPVVLSVPIVALLWKFLYHPTLGLINPSLEAVGLGVLARSWLSDPQTALSAIALTSVWHGIGIWVVLLGAGLERLPREVLESGRVDGAGEFQLFRLITLPLLRDLMRTLLILWFVQSMQAWAFVFIMTGGGPFGKTDLVSTLLYRTAFLRSQFGYATSMAVALVTLILITTVFLNRVLRSENVEY